MSSVWVVALGLAAGYLVNKNVVVTHRLEQAQKKFNSAAQPADPLASEEIRQVQRVVPQSDINEDLNVQDLSRADRRQLQKGRDEAAQAVVQYEAPSLPEIQGVYLHHDNHGV